MYKPRKNTKCTSISLPIKTLAYIDKLINTGEFLSRSEYIRYLIQRDKDFRTSEQKDEFKELVQDLNL